MKDRIKAVRKKKHLSQEAFGNELGITKSSVSLLESGKNSPSEQTIKLICSAFKVNEDWLRTGAGGDENMFIPADMQQYVDVGRLAADGNEFKKMYLNMMLNLPDEYWDYIYQTFKEFENAHEKAKHNDSD